jgi:glycosyltransferase involved in cell wall biosynthesis
MITWAGLGFVFSNSVNARLLRLFLVPFMRKVLRSREEWNIFLNPEDRKLFLQLGLASPENSVVILGEGVDTEKFSPEETKETPPVVLLASRLLWDKGVGDFVEAAKVLRKEGVPAEFWIAGEQDRGNPSRIPDNVIDEWKRENIVRFLGHVDDMAGLLKKSSLAVLPSYYMEGTPRFLLEAASAGLPIVATDIAGCRVVVKDGGNGFLVPIKQPKVLAVKIREIIESEDVRSRMGKASREMVLSQLDERIIVGEFVKLYERFC